MTESTRKARRDGVLDNLVAIMHGCDDDCSTPAPKLTKTDSRLEATQHVYEAAKRIDNVIHELEAYIGVFTDPSSSKRLVGETAKKMKHCIFPVLQKISTVLNDTGRHIAPIPSVKVICDRNERKMIKETVDPNNKRKSPDFQLLESFKSAHATPKQNKKPCLVRSAKSTAKSTTKISSKFERITLPPPNNGIEYSKHEAINVILGLSPTERSQAVHQMIGDKYVPCHKATLYRLLEAKKAGKLIPDTPWSSSGRPKLISDDAIDSLVAKVREENGRSYDPDEMNKLLVAKRN
jgi:hypothetical protein